MNWKSFETKEIQICDLCESALPVYSQVYTALVAGMFVFAHPACKDELESRLKELIKGN